MLRSRDAATTYRSLAWAIVRSKAVNSGAWTAMIRCSKASNAASAPAIAGRGSCFGLVI